MDIKSPEARSLNMSKIRSRNTKPEEFVRKKLFAGGFRYRKNVSHIPGHPDAWLASYNTAVFVHGCFWHRHEGCKYAYIPKSRTDFWMGKFEKNIARDREVRRQLEELGVRILIVWECTVRKMMRSVKEEMEVQSRIERFLNSEERFLEL